MVRVILIQPRSFNREQMPVYRHPYRVLKTSCAATCYRADCRSVLFHQAIIKANLSMAPQLALNVSAQQPSVEAERSRAGWSKVRVIGMSAIYGRGPEARELMTERPVQSIASRAEIHA